MSVSLVGHDVLAKITYFCLKYNSPLARIAIPEEAKTGIRRYENMAEVILTV